MRSLQLENEEEIKMKKKYKLVLTGIAVAAVFILGAVTLVPGSPRNNPTTAANSPVVIANVKNQPSQCSQCPYLSCPYLNHLHQMALESGKSLNQACPYEMSHPRPTLNSDRNAMKTLQVDNLVGRNQGRSRVKTVDWKTAR